MNINQVSSPLKSPSTFEKAFKLSKETILNEESNNLIGIIADCVVDDQENIWILDGKDCRIKKYNKNGNFLIDIGRKGRGPGEFILPFSFYINTDKIYVVDPILRKITIFSKDGKLISSFKINFSRSIKISNNGDIIIAGARIEGEKKGSCIHIYSKKGKLLRSFYPIADAAFRLGLRCKGVFFDLDNENNIYCVQETDYTIYKYVLSGELIKSFSRKNPYYIPPPSKPLNKVYLRSAADAWIKSWTHVDKIEVLSNGLLLVNLLAFKPKMFIFDIYDLDGKFILGGVNTNYRLLRADRYDNLYFLKEEMDSDIPYKILKCSINDLL